jgi:GDP-L-fucose synthase
MSERSLRGKRVVLTGGAGFLGSHVRERLEARGADDVHVVRSREHDLRDPAACRSAVRGAEVVIHGAANVGGIGYNMERPGDLFYDNAIMGIQLMEAARQARVSKFVALGTICAYPKFTPVPFKEDDLWEGYPEETNAPYGLAKKMMLVQAQAYRQQHGFNGIFLLPVNLYGPRDEFGPRSHVIPALVRKVHEAKQAGRDTLPVWGDGTPSREFLYVEDAAEGVVLATLRYDKPDPVNLGTGREITIKDLAELISRLMDYHGRLVWETAKPNGQPRRCLDVTRAEKEFGFRAKTSLEEGLRRTIDWYVAHGGVKTD